MTNKVMDIKQPRGSWEENYAHVEYMRALINATFAKRIDVATILKPCDCSLDEMVPERTSFQTNITHLCRRCLGGITHDQNDAYNQAFGFSGYDDGDDMWDEL